MNKNAIFLNIHRFLRIRRILCQGLIGFCFIFLFSLPVISKDQIGMSKQINLLQKEGIDVGIYVYSFHKEAPLYSYNENKSLMTASNLKILTSLAALKTLGPNYKFKTRLYIDGKMVGNMLKGNLYIKGYGDPKLVSEQLWFLVNELKRKGFLQVRGDLILDDSFFDTKRDVESSDGKNGERAYDAPLGALSVNFNTTTVYVQPGEREGRKAKVYIDPDNSYIRVVNQAKTGPVSSTLTLDVSRVALTEGDTITVSGNIPLLHPEKRFYRNISDPRSYAAQLFRRFFKERGIIIQGRNRYERVPTSAQELLLYESQPLRAMIADLNRFSNNFIAEQILKTMGAEVKGIPGTTDKGLSVLKEFLGELHIQEGYHVVNGSGLSQKNKMSALQLVDILKYGYNHFEWGPEYVSSLAIVGIDGTVEKRLLNTPVYRKTRVKTGSLTDVSAISGYMGTGSGDVLAFSILMNDSQDRVALMQKTQDELLLSLYNF